MDIIPALDGLTALLKSAGLNAGTDPTKLTPPCAWVHSDAVQIDTLGGGATLSCFIDLTVPSWKFNEAMKGLTEMLDMALTVITPDGQVELDRAVELVSKQVLPAFRIPLNLDI